MVKIKQSKKISSKEKFESYLKFNFTYISYEKDLNKEYLEQLYQRLKNLSVSSQIAVMQREKKTGIEIESLSINKELPEELKNNRVSKKYAIFRLYPNNNPIVARIIGKLVDDVFYILYIDIGGKLYKH